MPVSYSFQGRLLRLDCVGTYSPDELKRKYAEALEDPAFPERAVFLLDVTRSESLTTRPVDELRDIARFVEPWAAKHGNKCAILAQDDLHFGLMNMAAIFAEGVGLETQVFRTLGHALEWLGISPALDQGES